MSNRKGQNSILILTTLGVYLGLVLVGATPQVFAKSLNSPQMRRLDGCYQLESKIRERETADFWFKDRNISDYGGLLEEILRQLPENRLDQIDWNWVSVDDHPSSLYLDSSTIRPALLPIDLKTRGKIEETISFVGSGFSGNHYEFRFKRNEIETISRLQTNVKGVDSHRAEVAYDLALDFWRCKGRTELDNLILKNTRVVVENDNLVIITRLPRGSLDTLLAKDTK